MNRALPSLLLLLATALWGLGFPLIEVGLKSQDPFLFVSLRFTIALVLLLPYFLKTLSRKVLVVGSTLGIMNLGAFLLQTYGMQTVSTPRAAFLTGLYVVLVPVFNHVLKMGRPNISDIISSLICAVGVFVLTGCSIAELSLGDLWEFISAIFIALSVVYIAKYAQKDFDPYTLTASQIVMTGLFSWVPTAFFSKFSLAAFHVPAYWMAVLSCSILCTIIAIFLQSKYQKYVSAQKAAIIFSLEPVFAILFDTLFNKSGPGTHIVIGGLIILAGIVYLELWKPKKKQALPKSN